MRIIQTCRMIALLSSALVIAACSDVDAKQTNQNTAATIVAAIKQYEKTKGHLPETLDELAPNYLAEIPVDVDGNAFSYRLDRLEGYYLCFDAPQFERAGCCYYGRLEIWDCTAGGD